MRKSSKARLFSTCLTGAILAAAAPAWGQTSDAPTWKPRAEIDAQVGKDIGVSTSLFAPVAQNDSSLVYVDGRIGYDQRFDRNGSATIGARFRVGDDAAIGINAGADFYRSDIGSRDQAAVSMGLEGFTSVFDVRVNYRLPLSKTQTIGFIDPNATTGTAALVLENNRLVERRSGFRLEAIPLQGFNGEAGVRLPVGDNASIRGSVGGFDYWDKDADENYRGIRGGLELDVEDRNSGARFTFGGTVEHDNRYGTDARATVRLSVPFGGRAGDRGASPTGLDRQMGDRVRRDYVARSGSRYTDLTTTRFAVDARTGNQFGGFYYASGTGVVGAAGTLATPTTIADAVSRAGANGVVVALGSGGTITTPGVTLATNQYLLGGASTVDVRLIDGSTVQYGLGGTNGAVVGTSAAGATVTLGQGSVVRDVTVRGAGVGIAANGVGGFAIERVIVENTGGAGISLTNTLGAVALTGLTVRGGATTGITVNGGNGVSIANSTIAGGTGAGVLVNGGTSFSLAGSTVSGGAGAVDINDGGATLTTSLSNLTLSATGGNVLDIDGSGAGTVTVTNLSGITIRGGTGETGGLSVRSATFDASTTTAGIQTVNAGRMEVGTSAARVNGQGVFLTDVIGSLSFTDLDVANSGATGIRVVNSKVNSFTLATLDGTIDTVGGTAADLDPLVINLNFASVSSVGAAGPGVILNTVEGGGTGGNALAIGTLTISNSGGDGLVILNSTGLVRVNGGTITNSGGSSVRIGQQGVAGSGGSTNLIFGASITDATGASPIVAIFSTGGTISFTGPISGSGPVLVQDTLAGSAISFGAITLTGTAGDAITLNNLAGSINFAGLVTIANPGARGIVIGNVPGGVTFGNVDITGLGNFTGLDVTGAHGTVLFNTLDVTGTGGGKGIDVTGSTNAGNVIILAGSTIQGVNIGVDLTQANMTGQFRYGDGDAAALGSTIAANTPIVIALMNASNGSYNFADANLVGDTSNLTGAGFTAYYAKVGATGVGTRSDPGSLAGADASTAQYIVLLNDPAGGQDVFDATTAGGSFDLGAGQALVSFLNGDFIAVPGAGLPANLIVSGIGPSGITNVYAGSGGAVLTSSTAGSATINLASNSTIDGLIVRNAGGDVGIEGSGVSNVRILNSNISGAAGAIAISDGGTASSAQLLHLDLASTSGTALALSGAGAGTLTVSGADVDIAATGTSAALSLTDMASGGLGFGTITTGVSATGAVTLQNVTGGNVAIGSVAVGGTAAGAGVSLTGNSSAVTIGAVSASGSAGDAVQLSNNSGAVTITSVSTAASGGDAVALTGNGAVAIGTLTVSGASGAGLAIQNSQGAVSIGGGAISGTGAGVSINGVATGTGVTIGALNISGTNGSGIALGDIDGSVTFTGTTNISGVATSGIVFGAGSAGTITFGDVNVTGLSAGTTGIDARAASGTIAFNTLDITGSSTTGTRGIDLTGATFATSFITADSGSITGVGIGVDLTNAAITGSFQYGDGSNTDADGAASSINAVTPIVITGINVGTGSYNFRDVALTGDTSTLTSSATLYFVKAGATGVGTIADPGSLAGAEASTADTIILLNDQAGGQDVLDAAGAGGSLDLAAGRTLLSFLHGDTLMLPGGAPANLLLFGVAQGQIGNPFVGSGAPVLTTTIAGANTVVLGGSNTIAGVVIQTGAGGGAGIFGSGVANVVIRNSAISGAGGAIHLIDNGAAASVALTNLVLASSGGNVLELDGSGAGTLAVTALNGITIEGDNGETGGFLATDILFDADLAAAGAQTVIGSLTVGAAGARLEGVGASITGDGSIEFTNLQVVNLNSYGVNLFGNAGLTAVVRAGSIDTIDADALVAQNAALTLDFNTITTSAGGGIYMDGNTAANAGAPVLNVRAMNLSGGMSINGAGGNYVFANASITDNVGVAVLFGGTVNIDYAGDITSGAGASATIGTLGHSGGTVAFHDGTIDATGGAGLQFHNADGTYSFSGTTTLHGDDAGINIANGSSGNFSFGVNTSVTDGAFANFQVQNSDANVLYLGSLSQGLNTDNLIVDGQTGGMLDFSQATISASAGSGIVFFDADGSTMLGDVALSGGARIAIIGGSSGSISFDNVDITGLGANQTAVDLTGALGNVTFLTLDIAGTSTTGSKGIDLTGSTTAANLIVNESSSITGVGIGVDLTNAAITGNFRYGDGSSTDADGAASTISAAVPIEITGLNGGVGTYNFADVNLVGDTSRLVTSATTYFVKAGATGAGTMADPGSLSGAEASGAQFIVLLNDQTGGQDVLDAATAGGSFDIAAGQALLGFLNGDTLTLPAGGPANVILFGITPGQITNPFAGSGAPILTNTGASPALTLGSNTIVDGIAIDAPAGLGVYASGSSNVTIRNSAIQGGSGAILFSDAAGAASAALSNLQLAASSGAVLTLDGSGADTLTVTAFDDITVAGGNGELFGILGNGVVFDADLTTAGIQAVTGTLQVGSTAARIGGTGIDLQQTEGAAAFDLNVATDGGAGLYIEGGIGGLSFGTAGGTIDVANGSSFGLYLSDVSSFLTLDSIAYSGTGTAVALQNVTGVGAFGLGLNVASLTVADGATSAIEMTGSATGSFSFGVGSSIGTTTGAAIVLSNTGASAFNYLGDVDYAGADALLSVSGGHSGAVTFDGGTLSAASGTGLVFQNADGTYIFDGTTLLATGISVGAGSSGGFAFGTDTTITGPAGIAIDIQDSTVNFAYAGTINYSGGAAAAVNILNHSGGTITFTGLFDVTTGTGLRFDNADGTYTFLGTTNLDAGAAGIVITGGSSGGFGFGPDTGIIVSSGPAIAVSSSTVSLSYLGYVYASSGYALDVSDHSNGGIDFAAGSLIDGTNGAGIRFDNADGIYNFGGTTTLASGGGIGIANGSSGTFTFGAGTSVTDVTASAAFTLDQSQATVSYLGSISQGVGQLLLIQNGDQSSADFTGATLGSTAGFGFVAQNADGNYDFGAMSLANGATLIISGGSAGNFTFGDVDIAGLLANQTAVTLTGATGNITFQTLDIAGTSTTGSKGIDLTGSTTAADIIITESSSITGVGVGVDLTNAAITGNFRYGDGSSTDADGAASSINAVTPIAISGLNPGVGTYNFADVVLTGDTSGLQTSSTIFWVQAGATGAGTRTDPGSLAAAEASGVDVIILLDTQVGAGQDVIDAAAAGGSLELIANQSLLSFRNGDTLNVGGGAPANMTLFGIAGGSVTNPYAGSGAALLTTSQAGANTVALASGALIDGVQIGNLDARGVYAGYLAAVTIRNSTIYGGVNAIEIVGNGGSAALSNLDLSSSTGDVLRLRGDGGNLIVTELANLTIQGGNSGRGLFGERVLFDANLVTAGIQTVTGALTVGSSASRIGGSGLVLDDVTGALELTTTVFNTNGHGIFADGGAGGFTFSITGGTIDTGVVTAVGSALNLANLLADLQLGSVTYSGPDSGVLVENVTGVGTGGRALDIDTLTVASGAASGITLLGTTSGDFSFGSASSITGATVAGVWLGNTGSGTFTYGGSIATAASTLVTIGNGHTGTANFTGTLNATGGTGLRFDNADGTYNFTGTTTLNGGDAGIDIVNGSGGSFTFGTGTSITSPSGTGINVADSTAGLTYSGNLTYATAGQAAVNVTNHTGGTITFQTGTISATNGTGVRFDNADGTYNLTGSTTLGGVSEGIRVANGSAGTFGFGSATSITSTLGGLTALASQANITYSGTLAASLPGAAEVVRAASDQSTINLSAATFNVTNGFGISFDDADGTYTFGALALSGGARIAIINGSSGAFTFGNVDITGLGANQTAVNLTGATGNATFNTLDITGTSTTGSKGIDLTGNAGTGDIVVTNSSAITGVGVGVDLTNASRPGLFQYGDGESVIDVASAITATTPLVITGLNGATGTYNFADVALTGDTSGLATSATVYYVLAGATGTGTLGDPGSLAGAEAATVDFIILLNNPTGGQDVLDAVGSNGNDTLALDANQALRSFRDGNNIALPGGAPANIILTGVMTGQVTNPYGAPGDTPADRAPVLTTTGAANTVTLANNSLVDGVFVQGASGFAAIFGSGVSGITLGNSVLFGPGGGLNLVDGGAAASATLSNLTLSVTSASDALNLSGAGAGSLTVTGSGVNVSQAGAGGLVSINDLAIGAGGLSFGAVSASASGGGVDLVAVSGAGTLSFNTITVTGATGAGVLLSNASATVNLGNVTVSGATGAGIELANSGAVTIGTAGISASATGISATGLTGTLTVGDTTIDGATVAGILFGAGNTGAIIFDDVDITGLQTNGRGVDARLTGGGNVYFETLDISGASATGTRGIDLTGNTASTAFIVNESSAITGVGVGVDLTNASRTGTFRYGDGSNIDADLAASTINATTPIAIAGLNGATGAYDFRDATLVGDTSPLEVSAFFVRAGATGVGSRSDPGSLAGADASTASFIVLLDAQAGAGSFDTISGTLTLADNQSLLSFRDTDTFNVGGGAPPNVFVFNVTTGTITNPNAGSGAPLLTSADATGTVRLGGTSVIDGVVVSNTGAGAGIFANANAGTATIRNSTISGGGAAIDLRSGAFARIVNLQNLNLANAGNQAGALLNLNGTGGTLTVTGMSNLNIGTAGGETAGLVFNTVTFDSDLATAGIQAVNAGAFTIGTSGARVQGDGLSLTNVSGALTFTDIDIANNGGTGLLVANSKANNFLLTTLDGSVDTTNGTAVNLDPLIVNMTLATVAATNGDWGILLDQVEGSFTVNGGVNITGATAVGIAIEDNTVQATPLVALFSGGVSINNTSGVGISLTNNAGATINFAGGGSGVDIVTTSGVGLNIQNDGTIVFGGSGNSIQTTTGQIANLDSTNVGAGGISFAALGSSGTVANTAIRINNVDGGAFNGGTVSIAGTSGATSDGIWIGGGSTSTVSFGATTIAATGAEGIEINGAGNGAISFTSVAIDNTASHGILITGSTGTVTVSGGDIGNLNDPTGSGVVIDGGSGAITINAGILKTTAARAIDIQNRTGGSINFGGLISSGGAASGWSIMNNSGGTITFSGAGNTINGGATIGVELLNNTGSTINFTGGGLAISSTTNALLAQGGGTLNITGAGNTISGTGNDVLILNGVTVGAGGIAFASVSSTNVVNGITLTNVASAGGAITLGTVNLQGVTARGIDVTGTLGAALTITDLDIGLNNVAGVAFDLNGATLAAAITANDFDVTNAAAAGTTIAVDLRGTTGGQIIRLGDSAAGGAAASISGVNTGVWLSAATNATFTYGDGESATDGTSTISAGTGINAAAAPAAGTYDFRDVTFGASPGLGFGVGRTWFVDSNGATGGGNGSGADGANPMTLGAAELVLAATDVIVLVNNGAAISAAGSNGNDTLALLSDTQVRGFGQGPLGLVLTVPSTILLSSSTINIADPTGNGAATLTSAAGANVITLGASGNRISGFILDGAPGGALRGIVDNGGATGTTVNFMTIRNFNAVGGYGVEITPSTNSIIDSVSLTGNTNDIFLNAAGSTISNVTAIGATGTSITLNNATGTTALTNVNISGAATGLSFTTPAGTINATNVDIAGAGTSALTVSGGTASFNFDAASSIVQAAGGLAVNFAGNHTTGTFAFAGLINATTGAGLQFNNADGTYNFTGTTTLNGGDAGIDIYNGATGTFAFGSGTTLTHNGAGNAFSLLSSANVTFDGTITDNNGVAVEIDGHDAGTATFNGAISSSLANASTVISIINSNAGAITFNGQMNIASTGTVVSLSNNDGGTITFNAGGTGLDITGTTGTGMLITGGGTVNVQGSGNSIATTSGTLLNIANTGATATTLDLNFASASNTGGANGILVQRTVGLLTGTVNVSGGAITATTRGVSLAGDGLTFSYGGTVTTSGAAARSVEVTGRTGGTATLSGNLTDTSLGINVANNTGGTVAFSGQAISLSTTTNTAVTLSSNAGATINFAPLAGGTGFDIVTTSGTGFSATGGGTVTVTGTGNSIQTAVGQVINLTDVSAGASGINFASLQATGTVAAIAINLNNFDSVGGGTFNGGTTSVAGTSGGNDGVFIGNGSAANVSFGTTTLGTAAISGDGIEINGSGNGSVTFSSVAISNTTAHGIAIVGAAGATSAISINGGTIGATGIGGDGVNITGGGGSVTVAAAISKTSAGNVVEVSNHTGGTITFSGNLSATGGVANGVLLNNNSGGSITFSGATKTITTGANNAVQFDNTGATGAAVSFTGGGLGITTTSGRGITATSTTAGAGSLAISGTGNSITSAGGIALNLVNTNIAAGGLTFQSVSANGGARGILLNTTGSTAGLTITGSGTTDGSGGTIQNIGTRGLELLNTSFVNIANLNLTNANNSADTAGNDLTLTAANGAIYMSSVATAVFENINITGTTLDNGITGINVSNFQLNNSLIDGAGNGANESGIEFSNLSGTSSLTNTEIRFSETNTLDIVNTDVNLNLTLNNVIFRDTQTVSSGGASNANGEGGFQFRSFSGAAGSPTTNIEILDSDFLRLRTQGIQIIGEDDSIVNVDIVNSVIASQADIGSGIDINGNDTATVNFNVFSNNVQSQGGIAVNITSFLDSTVMGRVNGNTITANGSGAGGAGVRALAQDTGQTIIDISNNNITAGAANNSSMIDLQARFSTARLDATVAGNTVNSDSAAVADINITSGSSTAGESNQVYADIRNNTIVAGGPTILLRLRVSDLASANRMFLTGFVEGGAGIEDDAVATWNARGNTPGVTTATVNVSLTGSAVGPLAGTAATPTNPLP